MKRLAWLAPIALLAACSTKYIGNTQIEDTGENREVLRVLETYRRAVEDKDIDRLLAITSDAFFEDPGTPSEPGDDYDKAGLRTRLEESLAKVKEHRLEISARKVEFGEEEGQANIEYRFDYRYLLDLAPHNKWRRQTELNRVSLRREGEQWRITSGL